jgi:addiction module HigA family antidote
MSNIDKNQYIPSQVSPPGETLLETIETLGISQAELAEKMGRPKKTINEIIKGKAAITPETALQLERVLGVPAGFWNNRERHYREALAQEEEKKCLKDQTNWLQRLPVKDMAKKGWIREFKDEVQQIKEVLSFFGVASPAPWERSIIRYRQQQVTFQRSAAFKENPGAVAAWLRKGEIEAQSIECEPYDANKFNQNLIEIRQLTNKQPGDFLRELVRFGASAGVAVAFVPELPQTRTGSATRWLNSQKALIQLSFRYKFNDQFWFTFFHESAHILLHGKTHFILEGSGSKDQKEIGADRFAEKSLIPERELRGFIAREKFDEKAIERFALEIGIAPGIVVGRLQHGGVLPRNRWNHLKIRFNWNASLYEHKDNGARTAPKEATS